MSENGTPLDREGIFKARPFIWSVWPAKEGKKSVGINIGFTIEAQLDGGEWVSWAECEPHYVYGTWYPIGKDGGVNTGHVEQLANALGWMGGFKMIHGQPPDVIVQITVKSEEYNGKTRIKATWMNPGDFVPGAPGAAEDELSSLDVQFGSLLRAATSAIVKPKTAARMKPNAPTGQKKAPPPAAKFPASTGAPDDDPVPFG